MREYAQYGSRFSGMKCALVLLVSATAAAEPIEPLTFRPAAGPTEFPDLSPHEKACWVPKAPDKMQTKSAKIGGHAVAVLHDCDGTPAGTHLAIETKDGWFIHPGGIFRNFTNMSVVRSRRTFASETVTSGTFADGSVAVLYHLVTREQEEAAVFFDTEVTVCRVGDTVECGQVIYRCPASGCKLARFEQGLLVTNEQRSYGQPYVAP